MRRSVIGVLLVCVALLGAACGNDDNDNNASTNTTASSKGAQTREVAVDLPPGDFNAAALAYFPNEVTARPGDTVDFESYFTGEPHSVTFGKLVDACLTAAKAAGENATEEPAACKTLPPMLPEGPGDANQVPVNPCFLSEGAALPTDATKACPKVDQPAFNGKQAYYNSGFLPDKAKFSVKLADDIAPASYQWYCNLHGPDMSGTLVVKAKGESIPSQEQVEAAGKTQRDALLAKLKPANDAAKAGNIPIPGLKTPLAGFGSEEAEAGLLDEFYPASINAKVGEKVTWTVFGPHTISFNSPAKPGEFLVKDPTGAYHVDAKAFMPAGGPGAPEGPPSSGPPTGPPKVKTTVDGGRYDGTGTKSSGAFISFPPELLAYSVTFTKAGTYPYVCIIHPKMGGVVNVS